MLAAEAAVAGRQGQWQLGQRDGVAGQCTGRVDGLLLVVEVRVEQRLAEFVQDDGIALLHGTVGDVQNARALDGIGRASTHRVLALLPLPPRSSGGPCSRSDPSTLVSSLKFFDDARIL